MSSGKFASITSGLLARKGEASPWAEVPDMRAADEIPRAPLAWRAAPAAPPPPPPGKDKSCAVRMSAHDYERLGILAVKRGSSRQHLLKQALAAFLESEGRNLGCACLGDCGKNCGN